MGKDNLPRLVFLHGWLGSAEDWREVAAPLSKSYRCLALDLPGHGEQAKQVTGTQSLDEAVKWLNQILSELPGEGPLCLVGYSLGGRLAVEHALLQGERIKGLILLSARPGLPEEDRASRKTFDQTWSAQIRMNWAGFLQNWYAQPMFRTEVKPKEQIAERIQRRIANHPGHMAATLENWSPAFQDDRLPWLINCPVPLLYIAGSHDRKYVDLAESLRRKSPDRRVEILEDTGHAVHLDRPQLCANAIEHFLEMNRETLCL